MCGLLLGLEDGVSPVCDVLVELLVEEFFFGGEFVGDLVALGGS